MSEPPIDIWRRELEHLQRAQATASDPAEQFMIGEQIEEARRRTAELESVSRGDNAGFPDLSDQSHTPHAEQRLTPGYEFDVFLIHNSDDKDDVRSVSNRLAARGLRPWLDEQQLIPGREWQEALEQIIQTTKTAAVFFGPADLGPWAKPEMDACLRELVRRALPVIPVLLPQSTREPETLPMFLRGLRCVDLRRGLAEEGLDLLQWGITGEKPGTAGAEGIGSVVEEIRDGRSLPVAMAELTGLPDLPPHYIHRETQLDELRERLLAACKETDPLTKRIDIGIGGMGGIGKTVLASALAREQTVRDWFRDGIFWLTLGQSPDLIGLQKQFVKWLGNDADFTDLQEGKRVLSRLLADKKILLILDDVWRADDAREFTVGGPDVRILITSREGPVIAMLVRLRSSEYEPGTLPEEQALALLQEWFGAGFDETDEVHKVIQQCEGLPLALAICGAMARNDYPWSAILKALTSAKLKLLENKELAYKYRSVFTALQASVSFLEEDSPESAAKYRSLAVFPKGASVPEQTVFALWQYDEQFSEPEAEMLLPNLERKSLLRIEGQSPRRVSLHGLQYDFLINTCPGRQKTHTELVEAYWRKCGGSWANGPDDTYFFEYLTYHLKQAGNCNELRQLLMDYAWLAAKLQATDVVQLLTDFGQVDSKDDTTLVRDALRLSVHALHRGPEQLAPQLAGRLLASGHPEIVEFRKRALSDQKRPQLMARLPTLDQASGSSALNLRGHTRIVNGVAVTPDGRLVVSASWDNTLKVWDLQSGHLERSLEGHVDGVLAVALTPNGRQAVSASEDGTLKVWDVASGSLLRTLHGHTEGVRSVAITSDGRKAVSASSDKTLRLWDLETGETLRTFQGHSDAVSAVVVTSNSWAISASDDKTLKVWDLDNGVLLREVVGHDFPIRAAVVTPDARRVISASHRTLKVWDLESGSLLKTLTGHSGFISAVAVTADGQRAVSVAWDATLIVWDLATGTTLGTLEDPGGDINALALIDAEQAITASFDGKLRIWNVPGKRILRTFDDAWASVTANGSQSAEHSLRIHNEWVNAVAVTPDARCVVSASADATLKVSDLKTGRELCCLGRHVDSFALMPDGRRLVAVRGRTLEILDWEAESSLSQLEMDGHDIQAVDLTPDGKHAVIGLDGAVQLWDLQERRLLRSFEGHTANVNAVVVTPDGNFAVSASADHTLKVWELATGRELYTLKGHQSYVNDVAVMANGRNVVSASADRTLRVWDLESRQQVGTLTGHQSYVNAVAPMHSKLHAVSVSHDRTLKVWDLESGSELATFTGDSDMRVCAVAPDDQTIVCGECLGRLHVLEFVSS